MSVRVWSLLWDVDIKPGSRKLVALAYADAAHDDGSRVFPGEDRIARMTGLSDRQVRDHLAGLVRAGLVVVLRHSAPGQNAVYRFDLEAIRTAAADRQRSPAADRQRWDEDRRSSVRTPAADRPHNRPTSVIRTNPLALSTETNLNGHRRDELFEAVADACGIDWQNDLTKSARGSLVKAVKDLRAVGADPQEIRRRAALWPYEVTLTPSALAKHWPLLARTPSRRMSQAERLMRGEPS
jgi:hypothetical protein